MAKINYEQIEDLLEKMLGYGQIEEWRTLTSGQYRINEQLDIYPRHKRFFFVPTQERGTYENLEDFIYKTFN